MTTRFTSRAFWALAVLLSAMAAPLAQDRLVIDVSKARQSQPERQVIHYQPTGSVRHSDERTSQTAQQRRSAQAAETRSAEQAKARRTADSGSRAHTGAEQRTSGQATQRHGSVRLDTIR